ncbi:MAG: ATP-dependent DNA helicase RecG [Patescibacteria group bacterium]|jgi:ATP-dependent DNA helicase RecG|nr:ATP-dependent DNA helicase RecG [Patescibacteria group bacterium]
MMDSKLTVSVSQVGRVGKTTATRLKKLGIETVRDLIFYYPSRWQDLSQISQIAKIQPGETITVRARINLINNRRSRLKKKILTEALVSDNSGSIRVIWFNQSFITKVLEPGTEVYLSGKADYDRYDLQLINPVYEKVGSADTVHTARIIPIYSLTSNLTQKQLRFLIKSVLPQIKSIEEFLPVDVIKRYGLLGIQESLAQIHFPENKNLLHQAITRLKFDELFLFQLQIAKSRLELDRAAAEPIPFNETATKNFVAELPFVLTADQKKAAWQIIGDLEKSRPMNRLLEGDVGSGKTIVAAMAMLNVALSGKQTVVMAPTEILASQHYQTIKLLLEPFNFRVGLLTRSHQYLGNEKSNKKELLNKLKTGQIAVIVGTHTLIQEAVDFSDLALAVIDEQHRFGVDQRRILTEKSGHKKTVPHLLSMTATPIPRSLALSLYGDLDISIIRELPKERKQVITKLISPADRAGAYDFISQQIKTGRQVFIICPLIDPSDKLGVKSVTSEFVRLSQEVFSDFTISMLHGKMKGEEKEKIMGDFLAQKTQILVSTSVIEVGVDVPNAAVMIIEGAQRFGLAQLHQFRGRVGRGQHQSYCLLFSENNNPTTSQRLQALLTAKDGFELAELDLKFRGPGEIYGRMQSGFPEFKIAKLTDQALIGLAKQAAREVLQQDLNLDDSISLKNKLKKVHLE